MKQHCRNKGIGHNCALCCFCGENINHPEKEELNNMTPPQTIKEEFIEKFNLSFFATQDWEYDYRDKPSEFQFKSWQEKQTNIVKTKQDMIYSFYHQSTISLLKEIFRKIQKIDVSGGGSGRRLKVETLSILDNYIREIIK